MKFEDYLIPEFITLIEQIHNQGFKIGLVGGTVRDFFLNNKKSLDYDCELRLLNADGDINKTFSKLQFDKNLIVTQLPYNILRIEHEQYTCELSMPRVEEFNDEFSHSNFTAVFTNNLDYTESSKRRDFSINAMMYEFNGEWQFIDPCNGKEDLENRILRPCSEDFYKDPVRYLRAIRFARNLDFFIVDEILDAMEEIDPDAFSSHYLRQESLKTGKPVSYILDLLECLNYPVDSIYRDYLEEIEHDVEDLKKHLAGLLFLEPDFRDLIFEMFDYSLKTDTLCFPLEFNKIKKLNLNKLIQFDKDNHLMRTVKQLTSLNESYYNYIYDLNLVDIKFKEFHHLNSIPVNLDGIENFKKGYAQLSMRLERYFDS
jgi:hypothetical protein